MFFPEEINRFLKTLEECFHSLILLRIKYQVLIDLPNALFVVLVITKLRLSMNLLWHGNFYSFITKEQL